jgi:hypothetical protein
LATLAPFSQFVSDEGRTTIIINQQVLQRLNEYLPLSNEQHKTSTEYIIEKQQHSNYYLNKHSVSGPYFKEIRRKYSHVNHME